MTRLILALVFAAVALPALAAERCESFDAVVTKLRSMGGDLTILTDAGPIHRLTDDLSSKGLAFEGVTRAFTAPRANGGGFVVGIEVNGCILDPILTTDVPAARGIPV